MRDDRPDPMQRLDERLAASRDRARQEVTLSSIRRLCGDLASAVTELELAAAELGDEGLPAAVRACLLGLARRAAALSLPAGGVRADGEGEGEGR